MLPDPDPSINMLPPRVLIFAFLLVIIIPASLLEIVPVFFRKTSPVVVVNFAETLSFCEVSMLISDVAEEIS